MTLRLSTLASPRSLLLLAIAALMGAPIIVAEPAFSDQPRKMSVTRRRDYSYEREKRERERADEREKWRAHREKQTDKFLDYLEEEEFEEVKARRVGTNGKACMYGVNGEVIHRPAGAICDRAPGPRPEGAAAAPAAPAAQPTTSAPAKEQTKGRCIYGKSGKLLYAAPDAEC